MATSAFRSNTKRSTFPSAASGGGGGAASRRRSRSLSRPPPDDLQPVLDPRFPEISLDDLADEMFEKTVEPEGERSGVGRLRRRGEELGYLAETGSSSRRRGRSVSRSREPVGGEWETKGTAGGRVRRRSISVARNKSSEVIVKTEPSSTVNDEDSHSTSSNDIKTVVEIRRSYTSELEQSEKRRQELLAKLAAEEQRGQELNKIIKKLLHTPNHTAKVGRQSGPTRRRNDKTEASEHLTEEAEKIFEDFLSSIDDTDISSHDGERSDTSSTFGGSARVGHPVPHSSMMPYTASAPVKADGVVLPWLQWETNFPSPSKPKRHSGSDYVNTVLESGAASYNSNCMASSRGSCSPVANGNCSVVSPPSMRIPVGDVESAIKARPVSRQNRCSFDMDEYAELPHREELLFEILRQRHRVESGSLILCGRNLV